MAKLATATALRARIGCGTEVQDSLLNGLLDGVTAACEAYTQRVLITDGTTPRVETPSGGMSYLLLRCWPIVSVTSIIETTDGVFAGVEALDASHYRIVADRGRIERYPFGRPWWWGIGNIQVTYLGGYVDAATTEVPSGFSKPPADLAEAALLQASHLYFRARDLGATNVSLAAGGATAHAREYALLDEVKRLLGPHRR